MNLGQVSGLSPYARSLVERADQQNAKLDRENYFNGDIYIPDGSGGHEKVANGGGSGDMTKAVYDTDDDGKVDAAVVADSANAVAWGNVSGKPSTFTPSSHTQAISTITGLQTELDGKAATGDVFSGAYGDLSGLPALGTAAATASTDYAAASHTHTIANITSLQATLDAKAPLASPALTGNPTAPTQTAGDNSTKIATTAYADAAGGGGEANITPEYASVYEAGTTSLTTSDTVLDLDTDRTSSANMSLASSVVTYEGTESPIMHIQGWVTVNVVGGTRLGLIMEIQHKPDGGSWTTIAEAMGYARTSSNAGGVACSAIISAGEDDQFRIVAKTSTSTATTQANRSGMTIARFG